jgi:metal-responsive CopG/Arc/MetJ family transcriptional regulator
MPKTKNEPSFNIRLSREDLTEFDGLCHGEGKNRTELAREFIREGMARRKQQKLDEVESEFAAEVRKQTDRIIGVIRKNNVELASRLAGIMTKLVLENSTTFNVLYHKSDPEQRDELFALARKQALIMLNEDIKGPLSEKALEKIRNAISGET